MAEVRLIDADDFKRDLIDNYGFFPAMVMRALEKQPTIDATESKWISVKERLPDDETRVLCATKRGGHLISRYNNLFGHWMCADNIGITHWMPLPKPPKGE